MDRTADLIVGGQENPVPPSVPDRNPGAASSVPGDCRSRKTKVTIYLQPDANMLLRQIQLTRYETTGHRPQLSELVEEAIRNLSIFPSEPSGI